MPAGANVLPTALCQPPDLVSSLLEKCCLVGESVGGDPTHFVVERALADLGLDWRFLSFQIAPDRLTEAVVGLDALRLQGVRLLGSYADRPTGVGSLTARAQRTSRATHLTRHDGALQGDDLTGPALVEALVELGEPAGKRVVLLGAGAAAPSVADVLVERGAKQVAVADPSPDKAAAVVLAVKTNHEKATSGEYPECEVTPLAWEREWVDTPDAVDWFVSVASWPKSDNDRVARVLGPELSDEHLVVDLAIGGSLSPLIVAAQQRGAATLDGLPVFVAETALAVEAWTGMEVDRAVLRDAAEEFLGL